VPDRPPELDQLLRTTDPAVRDGAWEAFVKRYTPVLLSAVRVTGLDRDAVMDAYAYVLEALRANEGQRLAAFDPDGRGSFTTWLTVVGRRLAVDYHRQRFGRLRGGGRAAADSRIARRQLAKLVGADVCLEDLPAQGSAGDPRMEAEEQCDALARALATLAPRDRMLVRLRFEDEAPVREIARLMAFPTVFHVYRHLALVLAQLRKTLEEAGIRDAAP